ncbi:MAG: SRPBCC family protein, partial [Halodesulfurarchaeum sp.]
RLLAGSEIDLSVGPLPGVARTTWTSVIVDRQRTDTEAWFVDEMREGPMASWRHTHHFVADGDRTRLIDRIDYKTGRGRAVDLALRPILAIAFAMRQQRTREILSGDEV